MISFLLCFLYKFKTDGVSEHQFLLKIIYIYIQNISFITIFIVVPGKSELQVKWDQVELQ